MAPTLQVAVPACVERGGLAAGGSGIFAELLFVGIKNHFVPGVCREVRSPLNGPLAFPIAVVVGVADALRIAVEAAKSSGAAFLLRLDGLVHQALGKIRSGCIETPHGIDARRSRLFPIGGEGLEGHEAVFLRLMHHAVGVAWAFANGQRRAVHFIPDVRDEGVHGGIEALIGQHHPVGRAIAENDVEHLACADAFEAVAQRHLYLLGVVVCPQGGLCRKSDGAEVFFRNPASLGIVGRDFTGFRHMGVEHHHDAPGEFRGSGGCGRRSPVLLLLPLCLAG
jgi:hypothetical protein